MVMNDPRVMYQNIGDMQNSTSFGCKHIPLSFFNLVSMHTEINENDVVCETFWVRSSWSNYKLNEDER